MGTRYFTAIEEKNSRIKWEKADDLIKQKLIAAINTHSYGLVSAKVARIFVFFPALVLLVMMIAFINILRDIPLTFGPELIFCIFYGVLIIFFSIFMVKRYIKFRPYFYPEKQPDIWIFRAKCTDVSYYHASDDHFEAHFNKGGGHIQIRITRYECKNKTPIGKEYIFYKFNDRCGNRWTAILADKLEDF